MKALTTTSRQQLSNVGLTAEAWENYINFIDATPATVRAYSKALRLFFVFLQAKGNAAAPSREDIISWRDSLRENCKASTVQNYIVAVRQFFKWTETAGIYPNIAKNIKGAKICADHKKDYLNKSQVKAVLSEIDRTTTKGKRDYAMLVTMITGGLRTIEVERANIEDMRNLGEFTALFIQGKGRTEKAEYIKLIPEVERAIRDYLKTRPKAASHEPLFASISNRNEGERMTTRSISRIAKKALQAAGYDSDRLTAHSLRHTAVTLALLAGRELTEVQQFARHKNIATTQIYNHAIEKANNQCGAAIGRAIF